MTIQHDSMVHDGVCSTECQHAQPRDDSSTQPMDGPHAQPRDDSSTEPMDGPHAQPRDDSSTQPMVGPHAQPRDGPWPHARTKHVREVNN